MGTTGVRVGAVEGGGDHTSMGTVVDGAIQEIPHDTSGGAWLGAERRSASSSASLSTCSVGSGGAAAVAPPAVAGGRADGAGAGSGPSGARRGARQGGLVQGRGTPGSLHELLHPRELRKALAGD